MSTAEDPRQVALLIPGVDGHPGLLAGAAATLLPGHARLYYDHQYDRAEDGLEAMADRAAALIPPGKQALVFGESFGGVVALLLARRHPRRVRALVLFSTFASYPEPSAGLARLGLRLWDLLGDRGAAPVLWLGRVLGIFSQLGFPPTRAAARAYLRHPFPDLPAYRAKCRLLLDFDARPWLGEIACPTLVLTGRFDPVVPVAAGRVLAAGLARARLRRVAGGHIPHVARPAEVGAIFAEWLDEIAGLQFSEALTSRAEGDTLSVERSPHEPV